MKVMGFKLKQSLASLGLIVALGTLLVVLAVLQYRWTHQLSNADWQRQQATLQTGMNEFRESLRAELAGVCGGFSNLGFGSGDNLETLYTQHCGDWGRSSEHRDLVGKFYLWEKPKNGSYTFLEFNPQTYSFQAEACPSRLGDLCDMSDLAGVPSWRGFDFGWRLRGQSLAMVHPLLTTASPQASCPPDCASAGFAIIELNRDYFLKVYIPELAQRYFGGTEGLFYQVAIADAAAPPNFLYASEPHPSADLVASADATLFLFGPRRRPDFEPGPEGLRRGNPTERRGRFRTPRGDFNRSPREPGGSSRELGGPLRGFFPVPIFADAAAANWQLVVRHRSGSLRQAVAITWRRNLLTGLGALLVLAVSMVLILVWSQRVQRLARLQMDFVASVSHELRTPVSVICSAAENLADGVVDSGPQVKQYGTLIRTEGKRLAAMIEQVLLFAATRGEGGHYQRQPVPVEETIDSAVADLAHLTTANGFTVEKEIAPNLPLVMADPKALGRCLQNLMTNALKYGAGGQWMAIRAHPGSGPEAGEVLITVQDRGQGIEPKELPHIFEPFYRGSAARASQKHGAGLGLSLAKEAVEAMGGKLTVASSLGEGSAFTLHLPVAE